MKNNKKTIVVLMIVVFIFLTYESYKNIGFLIKNVDRFPLLKQLITINWYYFVNSLPIMVLEGIIISSSVVILIVIYRIIKGKNPLTLKIIQFSLAFSLAFALMVSMVVSMNQTQLDTIAGILAIIALIKPIIFSKKASRFIDKFFFDK